MTQPIPAQHDAEASRPLLWLSARWIGVFTAALVLFGLTAARTIQWQDYGQFTLRIVEGELFNELGLALAHPLHFWLGQLAIKVLPVEPAHAVALVSAIAGAVTVANVSGCVFSVTRRWDAGVIAAVSLAVANTFWRMSTMPECYTVTTALLSAELWCLALFLRPPESPEPQQRSKQMPGALWLVAAFFFNGLGLTNHNLALLTGPILGVVLLRALITHRICVPRSMLAVFAWFVGASPYLAMVMIEAVTHNDLPGAVRSALFGNVYSDNVMNASPSLKLMAISTAFTGLSFFNLALPLAAVGLWRVVRDRDRRGLWLAWAAALVIHLLFVLRYNVIDQHTFLLPAYTLIALFAGVGFAAAIQSKPERTGRRLFVVALALALLAPAVYLGVAWAARSSGALGDFARNKPYRDDYRYLFVPWGAGETSAQQMADHALRLSGDGGVVIVADTMARFAVSYRSMQAGGEVVVYQTARTEGDPPWSDWAGRPVVFVPAGEGDAPIDPPANMRWREDAPIYILEASPGVSSGEAEPR